MGGPAMRLSRCWGRVGVIYWSCQPDGRQNNPGCPVAVSIPDQMIEFNYR